MLTYEKLQIYLQQQRTTNIPLRFQEIETIIGRSLPPSAYKHRPWWSNNTRNSAMTRMWVKAGWKSEQVDMEGQKLVFRRADTPPLPKPSVSLNIKGLDEETLRHMQERATTSGRQLEDVAREILIKHAKPSLQERLSMAADLLKASPTAHQIDVTALIREDREHR